MKILFKALTDTGRFDLQKLLEAKDWRLKMIRKMGKVHLYEESKEPYTVWFSEPLYNAMPISQLKKKDVDDLRQRLFMSLSLQGVSREDVEVIVQ